MGNEPDETLMLQVGTGDHAACHELVERHLGRIVAFASRVLGDHTMAEDVAQEVFLRLWSQAQRWRPSGAPNKEAAQMMEISVEALESLLARGRRTLKSRLRAVAPDLLGDAS